MYNQIAIQPQHIKSCNPSPTHHPVGVGLHARPRGLSGHLTLTSIIQLPYTNTPTSCSRGQADRQTDRQTDRPFILINHSSFAIKMSQPNINTPNSDLVSSLSQSQSYLSPNFLVILPGLTSSVRLCGVERCPAQQSEEEEEEEINYLPEANTYFQKKDGHLITYKSGDRCSTVDYIITRR